MEVKAGSLLQHITLHQGRDGIACLAEEGKAFLPKGKYTAALGYFSKKVGEDVYDLRVLLGSGNFEVNEDTKLGEIEPLTLKAAVSQRADKVSIGASLTSTTGGRVTLTKNKRSLPPPKLVIKDSEGSEVATHTFKPG